MRGGAQPNGFFTQSDLTLIAYIFLNMHYHLHSVASNLIGWNAIQKKGEMGSYIHGPKLKRGKFKLEINVLKQHEL